MQESKKTKLNMRTNGGNIMDNKTMENLMDNVVETVNSSNEIIAKRVVEKINAKSDEIKEDKAAIKKNAKSVIKNITEITEKIYEAVTDHYADLLNGKGLDIKRDKANATQIIDKIIDAADEYYQTVTDHIVGKMEATDMDIEMDEAAIRKGCYMLKEILVCTRPMITNNSTVDSIKLENCTFSELVYLTDDANSAYIRDHEWLPSEAWELVCEHSLCGKAKAELERQSRMKEIKITDEQEWQ